MDKDKYKNLIATAGYHVVASKRDACLAMDAAGAIDDATLADLCEVWHMLKSLHAEMDEAKRRVGAMVNNLQSAVLPERFESEGMDKVSLPSLGRSFYPLQKVQASLNKENRDSAMGWLRDNGGESLITETVNANSLSAFVKDLMINQGLDVPEDSINVRTYSTMGSSKYTPKETI